MSTNKESQPTISVRIVAFLMIVGGVVGVIDAIRFITYFTRQQEFYQLVVPCCSILLFAWTTWVGLGVSQGKVQFLQSAKILFAMQVIAFNVGGYTYEFWNGVSARISLSGSMVPMPSPSHSLNIGGHLGSQFNLNLTRQDSRWTFGINLVALVVLIYLLRISRIKKDHAFENEKKYVKNAS